MTSVTRVLAAILFAVPGFAESPPASQSVAGEALDNRDLARERLFPVPKPTRPEGMDSPRWRVVVFAEPQWEAPEWQLVVEKTFGGKVRGTLRELSGAPIRAQLAAAREAGSISSVEDLLGKLAISTASAETPTCRALTSLAKELEWYRLGLVSPDFLCMDCAHYQFTVFLAYEGPRSFSLSDTAGSYWGDLGEHPHPLVKWAQQAREAIRKCK
jgi:hypothetical protein